jgi:flagellar protein FlgJ
MIQNVEHGPAVSVTQRAFEQSKLKKVCKDFESLFIAQVLKSMRSAVASEGLIGNSNEGQIIQAMFDENLAISIANGGGMGIGDLLYQQLTGR